MGWGSAPRPGRLHPRKDPVPTVQEAGWASGPVWTGGKSRPHRDSIPNRPAHTQSLYWATRPIVDKSTLTKLRPSHIVSTAWSMCFLCSQLRGESSLQCTTMKFLQELKCPCWWLQSTASYSRYSNPTTQQNSNTLCFRRNKMKQMCSQSSLQTRFLILRPQAGTYPRIPTCTGIYMAQCMFLFIVVPNMARVNLSSWEDLFWVTLCSVVPLDWKTG